MGLYDITIQDITDRATLNRATFYLHYRDKDDLLRQTTENLLDEVISELEDVHITEEGISLDAAFQRYIKYFEHFQSYGEFYRKMLGPQGSIAFALRLEDYIQFLTTNRLITSLETIPEGFAPTDLALRFVASSFVGIIRWWLENNIPFTPEKMAGLLMELYTHGVFRAMGLGVSGE